MSRLIDRLYGNVNAEQTIVSNFQQYNTEVILKASIKDCLEKSGSKEEFEKAFSTDLQKRFPNGAWRTINGSHVFINGGKVIAGLGGFNKEIDKFFEGKKDKNEIKVGDRVKLPSGEMGTVKGVDYKEHEWKGKKENRSTYKVLPDSRKNETNPGAIVNVSHGEIQKEKQSKQEGKKDSERDYMVKTLIEQSKRSIHPITKLTKDELNKLSEKVKSNWKTFWNDGGKQIYNSGGKNINENIVKKYPLEVWTVLRESMETSGMGMTDTSYLKRNEDRANKMRDIESKYDIKKEHANLITSRDINSYHERMVRDETLAGRIVPEEVLKDYPDIKKMQEKILKDYPELSKQQDKGDNKEKFLKDKNKADTQSIVYKEAEQFNKKKLSNENPEHIKSLYIAASTIDPKYLSKETKDKMDQLIEDIYVNSYVENDKPLYESTSLKDSLNVLSKESVKMDKKGEYAIDQKTVDNIQEFIASALKEQANRKTTEKKNYKLF